MLATVLLTSMLVLACGAPRADVTTETTQRSDFKERDGGLRPQEGICARERRMKMKSTALGPNRIRQFAIVPLARSHFTRFHDLSISMIMPLNPVVF